MVPGRESTYSTSYPFKVQLPADNGFLSAVNTLYATELANSQNVHLTADTGTVFQGNTLTVNTGGVLGNDTASYSLTVTDVAAGNGTPLGNVGVSIAGTYGHLTLNANGTYTYVADNAAGVAAGTQVTDTFTYGVFDGYGGVGNSTLSITVRGAGPSATADTGSLAQGATATADAAHGVLANDTDSTNSAMSVSGVAAGSAGSAPSGSVGTSVAGTYGHLTLNADGSYSYVADNGGAVPSGGSVTDTFTYAVTDANNRTAYTTLVLTVNSAVPTQTVTIASMTKDTGGADFLTSDGSANRTVSGTISSVLAANQVVEVSFDNGTT